MDEHATYQAVQSAAKDVLKDLADCIGPRSTEQTIAATAVELLRKKGITETWYYDVPAFVLLGSRSCLSISGKDYSPSDEPVGPTNLVTVDLSPLLDGCWGDCARSFVVEQGHVVAEPESTAFRDGLATELRLHEEMKRFVLPMTELGELYEYANTQIAYRGYENLDFMRNLGHSIEKERTRRVYIERGCSVRFGELRYFTFEPHIRKTGEHWGFKHENIYYYDGNRQLAEL